MFGFRVEKSPKAVKDGGEVEVQVSATVGKGTLKFLMISVIINVISGSS
jgi:hypothetical protein